MPPVKTETISFRSLAAKHAPPFQIRWRGMIGKHFTAYRPAARWPTPFHQCLASGSVRRCKREAALCTAGMTPIYQVKSHFGAQGRLARITEAAMLWRAATEGPAAFYRSAAEGTAVGRMMNALSEVVSPIRREANAAKLGGCSLANATAQSFEDRAGTFGRVIVTFLCAKSRSRIEGHVIKTNALRVPVKRKGRKSICDRQDGDTIVSLKAGKRGFQQFIDFDCQGPQLSPFL